MYIVLLDLNSPHVDQLYFPPLPLSSSQLQLFKTWWPGLTNNFFPWPQIRDNGWLLIYNYEEVAIIIQLLIHGMNSVILLHKLHPDNSRKGRLTLDQSLSSWLHTLLSDNIIKFLTIFECFPEWMVKDSNLLPTRTLYI